MATTIQDRATIERARLMDIITPYANEAQLAALETVIENCAWMRAKLDDTRAAIKTSGVAIPYDNGGGQNGIRENPLFKGYHALWKSYMLGMKEILDIVPAAKEKADPPEEPKNVLSMLQAKHKRA